MKKFDRLPPETRKQEIQAAAMELFREKGFGATTMENIVERVSLSKGGVYRLYPSTQAILEDLMLSGMRLRNAYYEDRVKKAQGRPLTLEFLVEIIADSLLIYPEVSAVYVEFLWEKQRNPQLQALYEEICRTSLGETRELIRRCGAEDLLREGILEELTQAMNGAILSIRVLGIEDKTIKDRLCRAITGILSL